MIASRKRAGISLVEMLVGLAIGALLFGAIIVIIDKMTPPRTTHTGAAMICHEDDEGEIQFVFEGEFVQVGGVDYYIFSIVPANSRDNERVVLQECGKEPANPVSGTDFWRFMSGSKGSRIIAFEDPAHDEFEYRFSLSRSDSRPTNQPRVLAAPALAPAQPLQPATTPPP